MYHVFDWDPELNEWAHIGSFPTLKGAQLAVWLEREVGGQSYWLAW